jgi:hypothetical protein
VQLEELGQLKNPVTSSGIEPATFQLVAQYLDQLRYCVSPTGFVYFSKTLLQLLLNNYDIGTTH